MGRRANYGFEKRQRELRKKKKKEEKAERKRLMKEEAAAAAAEAENGELVDPDGDVDTELEEGTSDAASPLTSRPADTTGLPEDEGAGTTEPSEPPDVGLTGDRPSMD